MMSFKYIKKIYRKIIKIVYGFLWCFMFFVVRKGFFEKQGLEKEEKISFFFAFHVFLGAGNGLLGGWFKSYKKRLFVLASTGEILYFLAENEDEEPRGTIHVKDIMKVSLFDKMPGYEAKPGLILQTKVRDYHLVGDTFPECRKWQKAIELVRGGKILVPDDLELIEKEEEVLMTFEMDDDFLLDDNEDGKTGQRKEEELEEEGQGNHSSNNNNSNNDDVMEGKQKDEEEGMVGSNNNSEDEMKEVPPLMREENHLDRMALDAAQHSYDTVSKRAMLEKTLVRLINFENRGKVRIRDVYELADGVVLCKLLHSLGHPVDFVDSNRCGNVEKIANITAVIHCLEENFPDAKINIDAASIVNGSLKCAVGLVWNIFYVFKVKKVVFGENPPGIGSLIAWLTKRTENFEHIRVTDLSSSFLDGGFLLCALLCSFAPKALEYEFLQPQNAKKNLERCFTKAKEIFNIPCLLDAEDLVLQAEEVSIVLYLTIFYEMVTDE